MNGTFYIQGTQPADAYRPRILSMRDRAAVQNAWLKTRMETFMPELMARVGVDMWIINTREYNEDPVVMSLVPEPAMNARRRTILVFCLTDDGIDTLTVDRYGYGDLYERVWDPKEEGQYECLARIVRERNPKAIALNTSADYAFADGLSHSDYLEMAEALGEDYMSRTLPADLLCVGWLEHRIDDELNVYPGTIALGHAIIAEAFSSRVIQPGVTTCEDVVWWMRQKQVDLGMRPWFQPDVEIQAADQPFAADFANRGEPRQLILPGDVLHCDMGFWYLGLASDQQQMAYVLKPGESDAPEGLREALATGNRLQDILMEEMQPGRSGNEVLAAALARGKEENINGQIYTHPIGYHGHAAGPTIGLWDHQEGVEGLKGTYPLYDRTAYSIELNIRAAVPEWDGGMVMMGLEEEAALVDGGMRWLSGRQERFHLIG